MGFARLSVWHAGITCFPNISIDWSARSCGDGFRLRDEGDLIHMPRCAEAGVCPVAALLLEPALGIPIFSILAENRWPMICVQGQPL
jgi:hypothetical protein